MDVDSELVRPTTPCPPQVVPLSPFDQMMFPIYIIHIHCFPLPPGTDHHTIYIRLKRGLAETLSQIPFIGGCLVPQEEGRGRLQIQVNEEYGMRFPYRDYTDESLENAWQRCYKELKAAHFPISALDAGKCSPVDVLPTSPAPVVMAAQANFINGGLLLATCMHHLASDATGHAAVLRIWAEHCRRGCEVDGLQSSTTPNWTAMDRSPLMEGPADVDMDDYPEFRVQDGAPVTILQRLGISLTGPAKEYSIFLFSASHLAQLKLAASSNDPTDPWISTTDALSALLWRHISRARGIGSSRSDGDDTPPVQFTCAVEGRRRLSPPLPDDFMGNCVTYCLATLDIKTLTSPSSPLYKVASTVRKAVNRFDSAGLRGIIGLVDSIPDMAHLAIASTDDPGRSIFTTSWADLGLLQLDWGEGIGRPECIRMPAPNPIGGLGTGILMPRLLDGGLEVVIGVEVEAMKRLRADEEFLRFAEWRCT